MSAHDFKFPKKSKLTQDEIKNLKLVRFEELKDIDDPKYSWEQVGTSRYGRCKYCPNTKTLRTQTMGEFYGGGIVD